MPPISASLPEISAGAQPRVWRLVFQAVCVAIGLWVIGSTVLAVVRSYAPVPLGDQWNSVTPQDYWATLLHQHNEHRIVVPRLFFIVDLLVFRGSNIFNLASILVIQLAHAGLLAWLAGRALGAGPEMRRHAGIWLSAAIFCLMLCAYQLENFAWGFQVQFVGVVAAASAACTVLAFGERRWDRLLLAVLLGAVSVLMMSNGVLAPLLLLAMGVWLRLPWRQLGALLVTAALLIGFYLHGYQSPVYHSNPLDSVGQPLAVLRYVLAYLGGPASALTIGRSDPLSWQPHVSAAMVAGAVGLGLFFLGTERALRSRRSPATLSLLAIMAFVLGSAGLTALGRVSFPIDQALSPRYGTPALIFWSAGLALLVTRGTLGSTSWQAISKGGAAALMLLVATCQWGFVNLGRALALERHLGETAILADVQDTDALSLLFPDPAFLSHQAPALRSGGYAPFASPWAGWTGTALADHVALLEPTHCSGALDVIDPVPGDSSGWRVRGWGVRLPEGNAPRRVVLTDDTGLVVGYAYSGYATPTARQAITNLPSDRVGFRGHMRLPSNSTVRAWLLDNDNSGVCPIGQPLVPSPRREEIGAPAV